MNRKLIHTNPKMVRVNGEKVHMSRRGIHMTRKTNRAVTDTGCATIRMDRGSDPKGK